MNPTWHKRPMSLCCITLLLSGCGSAPTRIYTLYSVAPSAAPSSYAGPPLRVDAVHFPPALDRIEIVLDVAPGELHLSDTEHWSAPLGETARQTLTADLSRRLPPGKTLFPHLAKPDGALGLSVDVLEFHRVGEGAELQASWAVNTAGPGQAAAPSATSATLRSTGPSATAAETAKALSDLLGQLADRIVAALSILGQTPSAMHASP